MTRYEINGYAVTTEVYAVYAAQMVADLQRERDELAARVARVEAVIAAPDDSQEWERETGNGEPWVERVSVINVARIRAALGGEVEAN